MYETYDNCLGAIGVNKEHADTVPLPPVYHDLKKIAFEVFIDKQGNFRSGKRIDEFCIVPTSEASESRVGSTPTPAPLFDDLKYMAGDFSLYSADETQKQYFDAYIKQLQLWCESEFCLPEIKTICTYLEKGELIYNLLSCDVLPIDEDGNVIVKELSGSVRIGVRKGLDDPFLPWENREAWDCYIAYTNHFQNKEYGLCYVSGKIGPLASSHPKISGNAKLISSNQDKSGFIVNTGFLCGAENALSVSFDASQKIHLALKWLIKRQGYYVGNQAWIAFGTNAPKVAPVQSDTYDISGSSQGPVEVDTQEIFAEKLRKAVRGYHQDFKGYQKVIVLGTVAVTNGRLSIIYYQETDENYYLENVVKWHSTCTWLHTYKKEGKKKSESITFYGAPALMDIVQAAYGEKIPDKLKMAAYARLVPSIVESAPLPFDIIKSVARQAGNPVAMEGWEHRKALSIACAVIKKYYNDREGREVYRMALDKDCNDRSYLFGRWLAYAHNVESYALYLSQTPPRMTNAERMMHQFSIHPRKTLRIINDQLMYYFKKIDKGDTAHRMKEEMIEIVDCIDKINFHDEKLTELYLLGYASQLIDIKNSIQEIKKINEKKEGTNHEHTEQQD